MLGVLAKQFGEYLVFRPAIKSFLSPRFTKSFDFQRLDQNRIDMWDLVLSISILFDTDESCEENIPKKTQVWMLLIITISEPTVPLSRRLKTLLSFFSESTHGPFFFWNIEILFTLVSGIKIL